MITSADLQFMRDTEQQAMSSVAAIYKPVFSSGALGETFQQYVLDSNTVADVWPFDANEKSSGNQEISEAKFYISLPYNTDISVEDCIEIDNITYEVLFVPLQVSWLTNLRVEARNYNGSSKFVVP